VSRRFLLLVVVPVSALAVAGVLLTVGRSSPAAQAGPPPAILSLDPALARGTGRAITLVPRAVISSRLVEVHFPADRSAAHPLAVAPTGSALAVAGLSGGQPGPFTVAHADGSQVEIALAGVGAAAFDPTGAWVAAVDMAGTLWLVDAATGDAQHLSDGPFVADVSVTADGTILAIRLSSPHAPSWAAAVRIDPATGTETALDPGSASSQLVYAATPLLDGSVAVVRHLTGGGVTVERLDLSSPPITLVPRLAEPLVAVAPNGAWVAWVASGRALLAPVTQPSAARDLGSAESVRFSPDGSLLLRFAGSRSWVIGADGTHHLEVAVPACWLGDGRGCRP